MADAASVNFSDMWDSAQYRYRYDPQNNTNNIDDPLYALPKDISSSVLYYNVTESSEHTAEYHPYFIKSNYPELIERYRIPLDEYPRRCENQIADWERQRDEMLLGGKLTHTLSREYGAHIIAALETGVPYEINGNVMNDGLITNLPRKACVEVPVLVDRAGFHPCYVGDLPEQCAALNRTNINVQILTLRAALSRKREDVYMAAYMDPHTRAELSMDDIRSLCDDLFEAHGGWLPKYA